LRAAFAGADKLLLVSGSEIGQRVPQHRNAIAAAKEAGVGLIAYTSVARADSSSLGIAGEHQATEQLLVESGIPHVVLRNGWYTENYTGQLDTYLANGIVGSAGEGRISAATRADYAEAAAAVVAEDGHAGAVYELGGEPFTMSELAATVSAETGTDVAYTDVPVERFAAILEGAGLPAPVAGMFADIDRSVAAGDLFVEGSDLEKLIGRAPTPLARAVAAAVAATKQA
jgi:NAD(P)H dehydrogenase (quinone)